MSQDPHPALSSERQSLREHFNVRPITPDEDGWPVNQLPEGVSGFTGAPATDELPLFSKPIFRCFEIFKLAGGELCFVGYVNDADLQAFQAGMEPSTVTLYPDPYESATKLVGIIETRVDRRRPPTRDNGNAMVMEIAPKPEFLGMTSTSN